MRKTPDWWNQDLPRDVRNELYDRAAEATVANARWLSTELTQRGLPATAPEALHWLGFTPEVAAAKRVDPETFSGWTIAMHSGPDAWSESDGARSDEAIVLLPDGSGMTYLVSASTDSSLPVPGHLEIVDEFMLHEWARYPKSPDSIATVEAIDYGLRNLAEAQQLQLPHEIQFTLEP